MTGRVPVWGALVGLLFAAALGAQEEDAGDRVLTLEEALDLAATYNPEYRQARNDVGLAGPVRRAAWGAFLPSLDLSLGTSVNFNRQLTAFDNFGNPIENPVAEWRTTSASSQRVNLGLTLFDGGRRFHELSRVGADAEARAAAARVRLATVRAEVQRQYFETLEQLDLLEVERRILEGKRQDLESTRRLFGLASVSRVDVLSAELEVQRQERTVQQVERDYRKALLALRSAIGDPDLEEFRVAGPAPRPSDPSVLREDALVARALADNPRLLEQRARVEAGRAQARAARGGRWPSLSLNTGFTQSASQSELNAFFDAFPDASRYSSTSLSLSIPVFSRFQTANDIAQAEVEVDNAREALRQTRLEVEQNIRSQLIDLQSAYERYRTAERSLEIAEEKLRLGREAYRLTVRTFTELQQDVEAAATERRNLIAELYAFLEARVTLEETLGTSVSLER